MTPPTPEEQLKDLDRELRGNFEREPTLDGMEHEAKHTLERALRDIPEEPLLRWLEEACTDQSRPAFASSALRCLAAIEKPGRPEWRAGLVARALASDDLEIREAGIQAAEHWAEPGTTEALAAHEEPLPWLRRHARGAMENMTGEKSASVFTDEHRRRLRELQNYSQSGELTAGEGEEMETLVSVWQQAYNDHESDALEKERREEDNRAG